VDGAQRPSIRRWLSAARHPARRDGVIAAALLVLPWALAWVLTPRHHLDTTVVTILVTLAISLPTLWLTWAAFRNASMPAPVDSAARPGIITAGPGSAVADRGGIAIGQVVYQQRRGVIGKPVRLARVSNDHAPRQGVSPGRDVFTGLLAPMT
jgi:hypothetical protein